MFVLRRITIVLLVGVLGLGAVACDRDDEPEQVGADFFADPDAHVDDEILVDGVVVDVLSDRVFELAADAHATADTVLVVADLDLALSGGEQVQVQGDVALVSDVDDLDGDLLVDVDAEFAIVDALVDVVTVDEDETDVDVDVDLPAPTETETVTETETETRTPTEQPATEAPTSSPAPSPTATATG